MYTKRQRLGNILQFAMFFTKFDRDFLLNMREQKSCMLKIFIRVVARAPELELSFIFYWKRFQEKKIALIWVKGSVSKKIMQ